MVALTPSGLLKFQYEYNIIGYGNVNLIGAVTFDYSRHSLVIGADGTLYVSVNGVLYALRTQCPTGNYQYNTGSSSACLSCRAGSYQPNGGASSCDSCLPGSYSVSGASTCSFCASGSANPSYGASR